MINDQNKGVTENCIFLYKKTRKNDKKIDFFIEVFLHDFFCDAYKNMERKNPSRVSL